jgi:hypothetical protein
MEPKGLDDEEVLVQKNGDIGYRLCRCHKCQIVRRCTPNHDFYAFFSDPEKWLYCEICFMKEIGVNELKIVDREDVSLEEDEDIDQADWWKNDDAQTT